MPVSIFSPGTKILSAPVNNNFAGLANGSLDTVGNSLSKTRKQTLGNFLYTSGWSIPTSANLTTTIPTFEGYVNGQYVNPGSTVVTVGASKDSYYDCKDDGSIVVTAVANGAVAPAVAANSDGSNAMRIGVLISGASAISSTTTFGMDSNGIPIAPYSPILTQQPVWTTPTLGNGWVGFGVSGADDWDTARYYRDSAGIVHLRGLIKSGTLAATAWTMPPGYRPGKENYFPVVSNALFGTLIIRRDGTVTPQAGSNTWFSFNGVTYRAEL